MTLAKKRTAAPRTARSRGIYDVAVLQKALDLLEVLAEQPDLGLSELSDKTGASKASTYRMLSTLESRGFVAKDADTRKYAPGVQLVALSCAVVARLDLVKASRPPTCWCGAPDCRTSTSTSRRCRDRSNRCRRFPAGS